MPFRSENNSQESVLESVPIMNKGRHGGHGKVIVMSRVEDPRPQNTGPQLEDKQMRESHSILDSFQSTYERIPTFAFFPSAFLHLHPFPNFHFVCDICQFATCLFATSVCTRFPPLRDSYLFTHAEHPPSPSPPPPFQSRSASQLLVDPLLHFESLPPTFPKNIYSLPHLYTPQAAYSPQQLTFFSLPASGLLF